MIEIDVLKQESLPPVDVGSKYEVNPSDETLRELGEYLQTRFKKLKDIRDQSDWDRDKAKAYNAYHMIPKDRPLPFPGAANLACPLQRIGVDAFHSNVMASIFTQANRMSIVPLLYQKDASHTAGKAAKFMDFSINKEADAYIALDMADTNAQIYGNGYVEPSYSKEEIWETVEVTNKKTVTEPDPMTGEPKITEKETKKKEKKRKIVFDGVKWSSLPVESVYLSPFLLNIEQAVREDVVFKVFNITLYELKERGKKRKDKPASYKSSQVEKITPFIVEKMIKNLTELEQARANYDGFYLDMISRYQDVEMAQAYLWWDIDGDDIKENVSVVFHPNSGVVVKVSLAKCRIVEIIPRPLDGRFDGEGIPKISEMIADEWEMFHNTRSNAGQWENTTFGFYRAGGRFNPSAITITPGRFYPVDDPREVTFAQPPRVGSSYFQEEQMLLSYFERIFALDENVQGVGSKRSRTATETMRVSSRASIRFSNPFNRIVTQLNKLIGHTWELHKECAPDEKEFYTVGEGGAPLFDKMGRYDFASEMSFSIVSNSVFDVQLTRDTMLMAYRLYLVNPIVQQHPEILWDLSQKTLDSLDVDVDLPKPPQAKTLSPFEEHEMFKLEMDPEPEVGEDYDHHLKVHMSQLNHEGIKDWDVAAIKRLVIHIDKTKILKATLEQANLNKSGMYEGNPMQPQPGMTANRNPAQMFNTMRVSESGNSAKQNAGGQPPQGGNPNAEAALNSALGPIS